jgi:hypothetical protein
MGSGNAKYRNIDVAKYEGVLYDNLQDDTKTEKLNKFKNAYSNTDIHCINVYQESITEYYVIYITSSYDAVYFNSKTNLIKFILHLDRPFIIDDETMLRDNVLSFRFVYL